MRQLTERLNAPGGALAVLTGNDDLARRMQVTLERTSGLLLRLDGMALKAERQVFGAGKDPGLVPEIRTAVQQINGLLSDARTSLSKVDAVLAEAQAVGANAREASADLGALRAEVDTSLRKVQGLLDEVNRQWPFARETELKLP